MKILHQYIETVPTSTISRARQVMSSLLNNPEVSVDEVVYEMTGEERWCIEEADESVPFMDAYAIVRFWCEKSESEKIKYRLQKMKRRYLNRLVA